MIKEKEIIMVQYKKTRKESGMPGAWVKYIDNVITYEDGTEVIRFGIQDIYGGITSAMKQSLRAAVRVTPGWWSLQTTSIKEVKAAYSAGFRSPDLSTLEEHVSAFQKLSTLYMELVEQ